MKEKENFLVSIYRYSSISMFSFLTISVIGVILALFKVISWTTVGITAIIFVISAIISFVTFNIVENEL